MHRFLNFQWLGNALVFFVSTLVALVAAELLMQYRIVALEPLTFEGTVDVNELARRAALTRGEPYDARSLYQVIDDARAQGQRAYPALGPSYFQADGGSKVAVNGESVLPMSITALADNYYCNESGQYAKFVTDRFGFRNPNTIWDGTADIVAVGDSFTFGSCLNEDQSIVGNLRESGKRVLNLGMGSNGPLIELASLAEYGGAVKPKIVLWNFYPNDMQDLERDYRNPILKKYLNDGFSQNLIKRAKQLNPEVEKLAEEYYKRLEAVQKNQVAIPQRPFYKFPNIRKAYRFLKVRFTSPQTIVQQPDFKLLMNILARGDAETKKMGAKLYFVYIPDCVDYSYGQNVWKAELLNSVQALGVSVIDTESEINDQVKGRQQSYFYCPNSHFNPTGAKLAAKQISTRLADDSR